ncbi:MAG: hypothetical protein GY715_12355 [Planctomycetes bacterium]|nr:hypothetical protein [Planctomycetota bacterium]
MSLDELRKHGSLLDEEQWSGENHRSNIRIGWFAAAVVVGLAGCAAIALGDGGWLTWIGIVAFLAGLFTFIAVNILAIEARDR